MGCTAQMISWVAEEKKLVANGKRAAAGTIIEAHLDRKVRHLLQIGPDGQAGRLASP
jgi:hypothetical protein